MWPVGGGDTWQVPQDSIGHGTRTQDAAAPCYDGAAVGEGGVKEVAAGAPAEEEQELVLRGRRPKAAD